MSCLKQKNFYNRETNSAAFCVVLQMFIKTPFPSMKFKQLTHFLIQSSQPIEKSNFSQWWNLMKLGPYCFSRVESLFLEPFINQTNSFRLRMHFNFEITAQHWSFTNCHSFYCLFSFCLCFFLLKTERKRERTITKGTVCDLP